MKKINEYLNYLGFIKTDNHMFGLVNGCISYQKEYNNYLYRVCIFSDIIYFKEELSDKSGNIEILDLENNKETLKYFYKKFPILLRKMKIERLLQPV